MTVDKFDRTAFNLGGGTVVVDGCTITGAVDGENAFQSGIESLNANVTIKDTTITGAGSTYTNEPSAWIAGCVQLGNPNADGTGSIVIEGGTFSGDYTVIVTSNATTAVTITGGDFTGPLCLEEGSAGKIIVAGGTFDEEVPAEFTVCAKIGDVYYKSLRAAVEAATAGDTITLVADDKVSFAVGAFEVEINKSLTIDGAGFAIYGVNENAGGEYHDIFISGGDVTIQNVKLTEFGGAAGVDYNTYPIWTPRAYTGNLTLKNVTVDKFDRTAFNLCGGTVLVDGCTITGDPTGENAFQGGIESLDAVVTVKDTTITGAGSTYTTEGSEIAACVQLGNPQSEGTGSIAIEGGTFSGQYTVIIATNATKEVSIAGGDFAGPLYLEEGSAGKFAVSGGKFSMDVTEFCAEGYKSYQIAESVYEVKPSDSYTVTFNANGGTVEEGVRVVVKGDALGDPPNATRKGYQLVGWYTAKTKGKKITAATKPAKDVTYYAVWKVGTWKVTAYVDGSGKVTGAKAYAYGKTVKLTAKPSKGYVFVGWEYVLDNADDAFWPNYDAQCRQPTVSFKMASANVSVMAVFAKKAADAAPKVTLDNAATWHLGSESERVVTATVESLTYAAASVKLPAGLKNGMKFAKVAGTDDQWTLKVTNLAKCTPGVYTLKVTAKNRAGKSGAASITVLAPNATTAVDKGALVLAEGVSQKTDEPCTNLCVGMKFDFASIGISPASGWTLSAVSGLPTGLKFSKGKVTGLCTKAGTFCTTFTVKKGKTAYKASVTFKVEALPDAAMGTFKGWTALAADGALSPVSRAVTFTAGSTGKLSAKVGTYSFAATGWTKDAAGKFTATLTGKHTVGKGKSKKTYVDTFEVTLDPEVGANGFQVTGTLTTTDPKATEDTFVIAQRNSFAKDETAAAVATALAARYNFSATAAAEGAGYDYDLTADDGTIAAKVSVKDDGAVTFLGAIEGRMASGSATLTLLDGGAAEAVFVTGPFVVGVEFALDAGGSYVPTGKVWMK